MRIHRVASRALLLFALIWIVASVGRLARIGGVAWYFVDSRWIAEKDASTPARILGTPRGGAWRHGTTLSVLEGHALYDPDTAWLFRERECLRAGVRLEYDPQGIWEPQECRWLWKVEDGFFVCRDRHDESGRIHSRVGRNGQDSASPEPFLSMARWHRSNIIFDRRRGAFYQVGYDSNDNDVSRPQRVTIREMPLDEDLVSVHVGNTTPFVLTPTRIVAMRRTEMWSREWTHEDSPLWFDLDDDFTTLVATQGAVHPLHTQVRLHRWTTDRYEARDLDHHRPRGVDPRRARGLWLLNASAIAQPPGALFASHFTAAPTSLKAMQTRLLRDPMVAGGAMAELIVAALAIALLCGWRAWARAVKHQPRYSRWWAIAGFLLGPIGLIWMRLCVRPNAGPDPAGRSEVSPSPIRLVVG